MKQQKEKSLVSKVVQVCRAHNAHFFKQRFPGVSMLFSKQTRKRLLKVMDTMFRILIMCSGVLFNYLILYYLLGK